MASYSGDFPFGIMDVVELLQIRVRRRSPNGVYVDCPFCNDRRGKMHIHVGQNTWSCNYCKEGGGMLALYARQYSISTSDAYREICDALMIDRSWENSDPQHKREMGDSAGSPLAPQSAYSPVLLPEIPQSKLASPQQIHQTYSVLLNSLSLRASHRTHLKSEKRGLNDEQIEFFRFKSTPPQYICRSLTERLIRLGCTVQGVPGFYQDKQGRWTVRFNSYLSGILLPVVGFDGMIKGMQILLDKPLKDKDDPPEKKGAKYIWFSSAGKPMGVSSSSPVLLVGNSASRTVYVTEGILKAYIAHGIMNRTFLATAGSNSVEQLRPSFQFLAQNGTELIIEAEDMDKYSNAAVAKCASNVYLLARSYGMEYDAIQVDGDTGYPGLFGACGEDGKSVVVINIGTGNAATLEITPVHGTYTKSIWDAEFDRVYFLGDTADFSFTSNMSGTVELSTDLGRSWTTVSQNDEGAYEAHGLVHGSNILRVTDGSNVQYQVVRASKLGMTVVNMTRTGDDTIVVGDTVRVLFNNIYTPVPKMSGIYNPGFGSGHKVVYTIPEGLSASASGSQYGFAADNQLQLVFSEAGTFEFTDGYIPSAVLGDDPGGHRLLTDAGRGVNFNAKGLNLNTSIMPDFSLEVIGMPDIKVTIASDPAGAAIEVSDESGNVLTPNDDGTYSLEYGTYNYKITLDGYVPVRSKFTVGGDDYLTGEKNVTVTMRQVGGAIYDGATTTEPQKDENGVYLIGTGPELAWYAANHNGASAKLTADVSLGGYGVQIQYLAGTFDGNGHYITDIYGSSLFAYPNSDAVIRNLGVSGEVKGNGGIVEHHAFISERTVGYTVENCVSRVDVTGSLAAGGIVGNANSGSTSILPRIINCYNTGSVTGGGGSPGGIAGYSGNSPAIYIKNCYNVGNSSSYGIATSGRGTNRNNYTLLGAAPNAGGSAVKADVLKTYADTLGDAYLDNPTSYNDGYPILTWEEPRALAVAKEEFPAQLEAYESGDGFAEGAKAQLALAVKAGKKAIAEAETLAEAKAALDAAKKAIDEIDPEDLVLAGDCNADGEVTGKDSVLLARYLAGQTSSGFNAANADFNGDGEVNGKDSILLARKLASQ